MPERAKKTGTDRHGDDRFPFQPAGWNKEMIEIIYTD